MTAKESAIYGQLEDLGYTQGMILTAMRILSQFNKYKISPLTNHKNTEKGMVTSGFEHVDLFQQPEQGFGRLLIIIDLNRSHLIFIIC